MADNVTLNSGTGGAVLATDDVSSVHYQKVKLVDGTDQGTDLIASGNGLSTNALRVTVSSDSTGVLSVDDNGGALTVDNAGTFATQVDGAALTSLQLIDDVVHVDDTATHATGTTKGALIMGAATPTDGSVDANDIGAVAMSLDRRLHVDADITAQSVGNLDVNIAASAATVTVDLGANNDVTIDGSSIVHAEDTAHSTGEAGVMSLAVRRDADTTLVGTDGDYAPLQVDADGKLKVEIFDGGDAHTVDNAGTFAVQVDAALPAGSNLVGDVGLSGARTSGGTTIFRSIDLDETEEEVKATAGQVYWIHAMNLSASTLYLKFYNATEAVVVVGTTTPVMTFPLATQGDTNGAGFTLSIPNGIAFPTAITVACTTGIADNDTGAPGANACVVNLGFA